MLRRAKHWHSRRAITSQGHQCDDASAVCTKAESSACFFSSEVQQESKHGLTSLPAASFSLVAARLSHAASPLSALSAPYCSQSQTSADRVDGSQQSKRCTVRSARIAARRSYSRSRQVRMLPVGRLRTAHGTRVTHRRDARLEAGRVRQVCFQLLGNWCIVCFQLLYRPVYPKGGLQYAYSDSYE